MNISCKIGAGTFNYRVAAVLLNNNKVLLDTEEGFDFLNLPGGRVEMFESSTQALKREIYEEMGVKPTIEQLLWISESMFYIHTWQNVHEICFYYMISLPKDADVYKKESFVIDEIVRNKTKRLSFKWANIDAVESINLKPAFLKKGLQALPSLPEHIIINELKAN